MKAFYGFLVAALLSGLVIVACRPSIAAQNNAGVGDYHAQDFDDALVSLQNAQVRAPDRSTGYYNLSLVYQAQQDYTRARDSLEMILAGADFDLKVSAYYNLGNVYFDMGDYQQAVLAYQEALRLDHDAVDARYNLELAWKSYVPASPTAQEQQTEPEENETDPDVTPTSQPGGADVPTPTPPPDIPDLTATPAGGDGDVDPEGDQPTSPQDLGPMTEEQAQRVLDMVQEDQQALSEFLQQEASEGQIQEKDW